MIVIVTVTMAVMMLMPMSMWTNTLRSSMKNASYEKIS